MSLSIATTETWKDKNGNKQQSTEWSRVVFFGNAAGTIAQYSAKGSLLLVEGKLATRKWTDKQGVERYSTEIIGDRFQLGPRPQGAAQSGTGFGAPAAQASPPPPIGGGNQEPIDFGDIPF